MANDSSGHKNVPSPSVVAHEVPVSLSCAPVQLLRGRTSAEEKGQDKHETSLLQGRREGGGRCKYI